MGEIHREMMEDLIEAHMLEHKLDDEALTDLDYCDVFPEDLDARPNSFEAILRRELNRLTEGEDMETAYQRAREALALLDDATQGKEGSSSASENE